MSAQSQPASGPDNHPTEPTGEERPDETGITSEQDAAIAELRNTQYTTRRATVPALEEVLYEPVPVLDRGFIRVIDYLGDAGALGQAAPVS